MIKLTQEKLKELLHYNPETGIFTWQVRLVKYFSHCKWPERQCKRWNTRYANQIAGYKWKPKHSNTFYNKVGIALNEKKKKYFAHRLAFLYMTGEFPKNDIDHIDGSGINNKWDNIRDVTRQENNKNISIRSNNISGFNGVNWIERCNKWGVRIKINGKGIHGGYFDDKEDAINKRKEMNLEYDFHENHGKLRSKK